MARARKWLRLNEEIKSIEDWNERVRPMMEELVESHGLSTEGTEDKYWFDTKLYANRVSNSLSLVTDEYDKIDSSANRILSEYRQTMTLKIVINLEEWKKIRGNNQ